MSFWLNGGDTLIAVRLVALVVYIEIFIFIIMKENLINLVTPVNELILRKKFCDDTIIIAMIYCYDIIIIQVLIKHK